MTSHARTTSRLKRSTPIGVALAVLTVGAGLPQLGPTNAGAGTTSAPTAPQFHGFANAMTTFAFVRRETRLPAAVAVSVSDVNHSWADLSWVVNFANGEHKRLVLVEEHVAGTYHHFGTGLATAYFPTQMPVQVCTGAFTTKHVTVR